MKTLKSDILNAVAYPPTILYAPVEMAGLNMGINVAFMVISNASQMHISPVIFLITLVIGHIFSALAYSRDAHIVNILQAMGRYKRTSKNIIPTKEGVKYVP